LVKIFTDAGNDLKKWYFNVSVQQQEISIEDLEDACKTAIAVEDYEKAALIRDVINRKKNKSNQCKN
jgi:protein-arginine kinase activator protein McsA